MRIGDRQSRGAIKNLLIFKICLREARNQVARRRFPSRIASRGLSNTTAMHLPRSRRDPPLRGQGALRILRWTEFAHRDAQQELEPMTQRSNRHDEPLTSEDLTRCHVVLEGYCRRHNVPLWSSEAPRIRAIIIEIYQLGVRDAKRLRFPVEGESGVVL